MTVRIQKPTFTLRDKMNELDLPVGEHGLEILNSRNILDKVITELNLNYKAKQNGMFKIHPFKHSKNPFLQFFLFYLTQMY
mgnify:CR=1 FL=1